MAWRDQAGSVRLGGRTVPRLGLGTNRIDGNDTSRALLRRAMELGIEFFDTADVYQSGASEATLGEVLPQAISGAYVATKGGMVRTAHGVDADGSPNHLRAAVDGSLKRLHRDRIDLYQLHRVDARIPIEDSIRVLKELQDSGRVRNIGVSNVTLSELERACRVADIASVQNRYNVVEREAEDVLGYCEENKIVFIPWTPFLRGKISESAAVAAVARKQGATAHQVALAWLLRRSPAILPIPGTLSEQHLRENLAAAGLPLSAGDLRELEVASGSRSP